MFILAEIFQALAILVNGVATILFWLILIRIVISWFPIDPFNTFVSLLHQVTEPILAPFRRLPLQFGPIDFSAYLAIVILMLIQRVLVRVLLELAVRFGA
jgi:YggT family protein